MSYQKREIPFLAAIFYITQAKAEPSPASYLDEAGAPLVETHGNWLKRDDLTALDKTKVHYVDLRQNH